MYPIYSIIGAVVGLCFFVVPLWAYRRGLQDGIALQTGKPIEPLRVPMPSASKQPTPQEDTISQGLANIMSYDGSSQEEGK